MKPLVVNGGKVRRMFRNTHTHTHKISFQKFVHFLYNIMLVGKKNKHFMLL